MSYIREIWFPNREQSKVFTAIIVLCLYATQSLIFLSIMLNWLIEGNFTLCISEECEASVRVILHPMTKSLHHRRS